MYMIISVKWLYFGDRHIEPIRIFDHYEIISKGEYEKDTLNGKYEFPNIKVLILYHCHLTAIMAASAYLNAMTSSATISTVGGGQPKLNNLVFTLVDKERT